MKHQDRTTEQQVLDVYLNENPSTYKIEDSEEEFRKNDTFNSRLYGSSLKLLPQVFRDATLLEFGSGTGERSLSFLNWGARCTFVEINKQAIDRAGELYKKFVPDADYRFVNSSLFDFSTDEKYDITLSIGVIHHTANKEEAFSRQVSFLKPGGINILGIGNTGGFVQRNLQRLILHTFAGEDTEKIETIAEDLFKEHLDRAEKFGGRKRRAIIHDTYVNPKMDFVSIAELLGWYRKMGLKFYSSWPPVIPAILGDSLNGETDWNKFPELLSRPEWIWGTQLTDDRSLMKLLEEKSAPRSSSFRSFASTLNDVDADQLAIDAVRSSLADVQRTFRSGEGYDLVKIRNFIPWLKEIDRLLQALEKKNYAECSDIVKNSSMLFRGKTGLGMTYFAAVKEDLVNR